MERECRARNANKHRGEGEGQGSAYKYLMSSMGMHLSQVSGETASGC